MKILITGAAGMLGSDLADRLGRRFEAVGTGRSRKSHTLIPFHPCDLAVSETVEDLFRRLRPDLVFHAAAMTHVDACERQKADAVRNNVLATQHVVEASNRAGAFLIFFSTDYVFDGEKKGPYAESDAPFPLNVYGETKLAAERYVTARANRYWVMRLSWLFGLRGPSFVRTILRTSNAQNSLRVVADQIGRPTYTRDVADALAEILERHPEAFHLHRQDCFHLANEGMVSWADLAAFVLKTAGRGNVTVEPVRSSELDRPARRPRNSVLCLDKIRQAFGTQLRHWSEAVPEFMEELAREGAGLEHAER